MPLPLSMACGVFFAYTLAVLNNQNASIMKRLASIDSIYLSPQGPFANLEFSLFNTSLARPWFALGPFVLWQAAWPDDYRGDDISEHVGQKG